MDVLDALLRYSAAPGAGGEVKDVLLHFLGTIL